MYRPINRHATGTNYHMLDIKFIRENADKVKKATIDKNINLDVDHLLDVDTMRRTLMTELESMQATKNRVSQEIPKLSAEDKKSKLLEMKEVDEQADKIKWKLK